MPNALVGKAVLDLGVTRLNQVYRNVLVPKDDPNWNGPWDCAEFASWLTYQCYGFLYGIADSNMNPHTADAYTGGWERDAKTKGRIIPYETAARIPGAFLLRFPPYSGAMGHIVVSDGTGGTVEAMGQAYGVTRGRVAHREWDVGVLLPGVEYDDTAVPGPHPVPGQPPAPPPPLPPSTLILRRRSPMHIDERVRTLQTALQQAGFNPGPIDGLFGPKTEAAVIAYQDAKGLEVDGEVGPQTGRALGLPYWPANVPIPPSEQPQPTHPPEPPTVDWPIETRSVIPSAKFANIRDEYVVLWHTMAIRDSKLPEIDGLVNRIALGRPRYDNVAANFPGLPWAEIGVIHAMEGNASFNTHLHNGDPISAPTVNWPPGRPPGWQASMPWETSARDAITYDGLDNWDDWTLAGMLYRLERFNGMGTRTRYGRATAYLWSYANHFVTGKYTSDHNYDPGAISKQPGAAVLLRRMVDRNIVPPPAGS